MKDNEEENQEGMVDISVFIKYIQYMGGFGVFLFVVSGF